MSWRRKSCVGALFLGLVALVAAAAVACGGDGGPPAPVWPSTVTRSTWVTSVWHRPSGARSSSATGRCASRSIDRQGPAGA